MDFEVQKSFRRFWLPQDSMVTCWAACATMLMAYKANTLLMENQVLSGPALAAFQNKQILPMSQVQNFFKNTMGFLEEPLTLGTPYQVDKLKEMMTRFGPLIVSAPVMGTRSTHVRVLYGIWGRGSNDDGSQYKVFDPAGIGDGSGGTLNDLRILYTHFNYQLEEAFARQGSGVIWHLPSS